MDGIGRAITLYEQKKAKQRDNYRKKVGILQEEFGKNSSNPSNPSNPSNLNPGEDTASPTVDSLKQSFRDLESPTDDFNKRMAQLWGKHKWGAPISIEKAMHHIQVAIFRKAKPKEIEELFFDQKRCEGMTIWNALETISPRKNGQPAYDCFGEEIK